MLVSVILVTAALGVYLFFGESLLYRFGYQDPTALRNVARPDTEILTIGYAYAPNDYDPVLFDPVSRSRMTDVYESLVRTDENLNIKPALASTWGLIDPYTWEFVIRKNVKFHDGTTLTVNDVVYSLNRAMKDQKSQLKSLLSTISAIETSDEMTIRIKTSVPDPLLLSKMAAVYISQDGYANFNEPVGTGPYKVMGLTTDEMFMERFGDYWGETPAFKSVIVKMIADREERIQALESGEVNFLANLPPNYACSFFEEFKDISGCKSLKNKNIVVKATPGLEVSFIAFNFNNELLKEKKYRVAIKKALDPEVFKKIAFGFAIPARQFVSSGVFGFNPDIMGEVYDIDEAKKLVDEVVGESFSRIAVTFDYPDSLPPVGLYVQGQLRDLGIDVDLNPLSDAELAKKIMAGDSDMYYMGWRSELGDASDFLLAGVHSVDANSGYGSFNGMNYNNLNVDELIGESQKNLDTQARLEQLQEAMRIITEDDVVGVPLFESEVLYAYTDDLNFKSRVDGYVYASNIK